MEEDETKVIVNMRYDPATCFRKYEIQNESFFTIFLTMQPTFKDP